MYEYKIKEIVKIYDGDTITVILDLGFNTSKLEVIRLARINTPEIEGDKRFQGLTSRDYFAARVMEAFTNGEDIILKTYKDHKGRYIGDLFINGVCINDELVKQNLAEYVEY